MSVMEFIASLVRSLAWPAAVVFVAVLLRHQLRALLTGPLRRMRAGPFELEWDRVLSEAEAEMDRPPSHPSEPPSGPLIDELSPLAATMPDTAVMEAHRRVERELRHLFGDDRDAARAGAVALARMALERNLITPESARAVEGLSVLRNLTAHGHGNEVSPERALDYVAMADAVLFALSHEPPKT